MRHITVVTAGVCAVLLAGCTAPAVTPPTPAPDPTLVTSPASTTTPTPVVTPLPTTTYTVTPWEPSTPSQEPTLYPPDLSNEGGIQAYLRGEWESAQPSEGGMVARLSVGEDLVTEFSIVNAASGKVAVAYSGRIELGWYVNRPQDVQDVLELNLAGDGVPDARYQFYHRGIVDGRRIMSWFAETDGPSVFGRLETPPSPDLYWPAILHFAQVTGEQPMVDQQPRAGESFHAVYWGPDEHGRAWLDDVWWQPMDDPGFAFPGLPFLRYDNEVEGSLAYPIAEKMRKKLPLEQLSYGQVHYVQTNAAGEIVFIQTAWDNTKDELKRVEKAIVKGPLAKAEGPDVAVMFTGAPVYVEGSPCDLVVIGTRPDGTRFVPKQHYAVDLYNKVHKYNTAKGWGEQYPG